MSFIRPEIIRPPSEARSYFLPLTSGCSNSSCSYCNFYGSKLKIRDAGEIISEIDALALYLQKGMWSAELPDIACWIARQWDGRRIFLQDGDALVYPFEKLKAILEHLNERFPEIERIGSYATPQDILRLSVEELEQLRSLKLGILYMGLESGDDSVLQAVGKGVKASQSIEAGKRIKAAGILSSITVILGLGGSEKSEEHAQKTIYALNEMDPDYVGALTLMLVPGSPIYDSYNSGKFSLISPLETVRELKILVEQSVFTHCFFSSMHASNYLSVRGTLPDDKPSILKQLDGVLKHQDTARLKPEFLRGL